MTDFGSSINRREFLKVAGASTAALALAPAGLQAEEASSNAAKLPKRKFGKTDIEVSILGFAGLLLAGKTQEVANRAVARAVERGVTLFDVAPAYGNAQERMGPALKPYRKDVFLSCKTKARKAAAAEKEMKRSFELLQTDHFDLYQLHALVYADKDVEAAFAEDGIMKFLLEAKKDGRIRHIGFTAHTTEAALAAMNKFDFDSIMFPLNFASFQFGQFGPQMLAAANQRGMAVLAIKGLCRQEWPKGDYRKSSPYKNMWYEPLSDPKEADLGLRFTLSQKITTAIPPANEDLQFLAVDIGSRFKPLNAEEQAACKELASKMIPMFRADKIVA